MAKTRKTGKAVELDFDSENIHITKCTAKTTKEHADASDSSDYDDDSGLIHKTQLAHSVQTELDVEGNIHFGPDGHLDILLAACYSDDGAATGTLKVDDTGQIMTGKWDIEDFEADISTTDTCKFKCTLKSNGIITVGGGGGGGGGGT